MSAAAALPRLVATDLDGTLVRSDGSVSDYTAGVLVELERRGVPVVFVTGRPLRWAEVVFEHVGSHGLAIVSNGALVWDVARSTVHLERPIAPGLGQQICARIREAVPGSTFATESLDGIDLEDVFMERRPLPPGARRVPMAELFARPALKVLARHEELDAEEYWKQVEAVVRGDLTVTWSSSSALLVISGPDVTKASTLEIVCRDLGSRRTRSSPSGTCPTICRCCGGRGRRTPWPTHIQRHRGGGPCRARPRRRRSGARAGWCLRPVIGFDAPVSAASRFRPRVARVLRVAGAALLAAAVLGLGPAGVAPAVQAAQAVTCSKHGSRRAQERACRLHRCGDRVDPRRGTDGLSGAIFTQDVDVDRVYKGNIYTQTVQVRTDVAPRSAASASSWWAAPTSSSPRPTATSGRPRATAARPSPRTSSSRRSSGSWARAARPPRPWRRRRRSPRSTRTIRTVTRAAAPGLALIIVGLLGLVVVRRFNRR